MFKDVTSAERRRRNAMTAIKKIEAAIERFPYLEKYIIKFADEGKKLKLEFLPYSSGLFFLRCCFVYFYNSKGEEILGVNSPKTIETYVKELDSRHVLTFVKIIDDGIQVYLPPENCGSTAFYMDKILKQERKEGRTELEKVIAGLYKKERVEHLLLTDTDIQVTALSKPWLRNRNSNSNGTED